LPIGERFDVRIIFVVEIEVDIVEIRNHLGKVPGVCTDSRERGAGGPLNLLRRESERLTGLLEPLQQVDGHELCQPLLTTELALARQEIVSVLAGTSVDLVLRPSAREDVCQWRVDGESKRLELFENVVEARHAIEIRERLADRLR